GSTRPVQAHPLQQAMTRQVVATREPAVSNRAASVPGITRTVTPPPVRTVRAAPPTQAQPLQRGARGTGGAPPSNEAAPRPGQPENRPGAPGNNRPGAENNRNVAPKPGAPENNRPGAENNRTVPRPGAPEA